MMLVTSPIAGRITNRIGARAPLILGSIATCISFLILAFAHDQPWEIYVAAGILGVGIGLAFASLANLIVDAVRPEQTGVATGMNTVMRSLGGSVGAQIGASIIAGTVVAGAAPHRAGLHDRVPRRRVRLRACRGCQHPRPPPLESRSGRRPRAVARERNGLSTSPMGCYCTILVALDSSPDARAGLHHAATLACDQHARLIVISVVPPPRHAVGGRRPDARHRQRSGIRPGAP